MNYELFKGKGFHLQVAPENVGFKAMAKEIKIKEQLYVIHLCLRSAVVTENDVNVLHEVLNTADD